MTEPNLPPEFQIVLDLLGNQPPRVQAMFRYAIVLIMIDDEKAQQIGTRTENGQEFIAVKTITGDEFEVVRPEMSEEIEKKLLEQVREIVAEDSGESI